MLSEYGKSRIDSLIHDSYSSSCNGWAVVILKDSTYFAFAKKNSKEKLTSNNVSIIEKFPSIRNAEFVCHSVREKNTGIFPYDVVKDIIQIQSEEGE